MRSDGAAAFRSSPSGSAVRDPNQTVQRTVASRHAEWRCRRPGWPAPVADLGVRFPDQDQADRHRTSGAPDDPDLLPNQNDHDPDRAGDGEWRWPRPDCLREAFRSTTDSIEPWRSSEREPAGAPSGDAGALGGWPPSLTFTFAK